MYPHAKNDDHDKGGEGGHVVHEEHDGDAQDRPEEADVLVVIPNPILDQDLSKISIIHLYLKLGLHPGVLVILAWKTAKFINA